MCVPCIVNYDSIEQFFSLQAMQGTCNDVCTLIWYSIHKEHDIVNFVEQ